MNSLSPLELHRYGTVSVSGHDLWILDILFTHKFDLLNKTARTTHYENVPIHLIGFQELIDMKKKAGRPQDLIDAEYLNSLH